MKCKGRKAWGECVKKDIELLGLEPKWAILVGLWWDLI